MTDAPAQILVIDDDKAMRDACYQILNRQGYQVELAASARQGLTLLERSSYDAILLDLVMPDMDGLEALKKIKALDPEVEVIIISGYGTIQSAVETIKAGAFHFLSKPFVPDDLRNLVNRALEKRRLDLENLYLRQELKCKEDKNVLVYESESMARIMDMIARVAPTDSTVLITGESGTGKGLVARKIYQLSQRTRRPFITVDCGTLVETLFESELFGHVKGSFTGADANKIGKFELAQHGTLFFDEISNIGLEVQAKLLRAVEERKISKVGSHRVITVDVRILAATHRDTWLDKGITVFVFVGFAVPTFWFALLLMYLFGVKLNWLPISGLHTLGSDSFGILRYLWDLAKHLIMPVMVASFGSLAGLSRYMRSTMLNVIGQDYITTARAKGLSERTVIYKHALRNAILTLGKIPRWVLLDNGKAFKAKIFTSDINLTDTEILGMFARAMLPTNANLGHGVNIGNPFKRFFDQLFGPPMRGQVVMGGICPPPGPAALPRSLARPRFT